jgi:hypothetical protein
MCSFCSCSRDVPNDTLLKKKKEKKKKKVERALYRGALKSDDEPVTVVCSRYEKGRKPLSLIRTCQEPVV